MLEYRDFYKWSIVLIVMLTEKQASKMTPLNLINVIDGTEGEMWRLGHEVSHGRTTNEAIASDIADYEAQRKLAYKVLADKTGMTGRDEIVKYARDELRAQNKGWDDEWALIHNEGAVFTFPPKKDFNWEVLGAYVTRKGSCDRKELIVARIQGLDSIMYFDDRKIPEMERVSVQPIYQDLSPAKRGLIKVDDYMTRRPRDEVVQGHEGVYKQWRDFNFAGTFIHSGFGKYHTMTSYNSVEDGRDSDNEIILAAPNSGQKYWIEFKEADMADMTLVQR